MFNKLFRKKPFKNITIQRLNNDPHEFFGNKLSGRHFDYVDGDDGEANLYQLEDEQLAIELRLTDSQDHMHVLLKFKTIQKSQEFIDWMNQDIQRTKSQLQALLQ